MRVLLRAVVGLIEVGHGCVSARGKMVPDDTLIRQAERPATSPHSSFFANETAQGGPYVFFFPSMDAPLLPAHRSKTPTPSILAPSRDFFSAVDTGPPISRYTS